MDMGDKDHSRQRPVNTAASVDDADDEEYEVEYRVKPVAMSQPIVLNHRSMHPAADEIIAHFDEYGTTPPRTRIKNKTREWDRRQKVVDGSSKKNGDGPALSAGLTRMNRSRVNRRNTMDCAILNEMFVADETTVGKSASAADKRSKQLLRESERDIKRATMSSMGTSAGGIGSVVEASNMQLLLDERAESFPATLAASNNNFVINPMIYCSNKYKSVACRTSAPPTTFQPYMAAVPVSPDPDPTMCTFDRSKLQVRRNFHETFANLIKLGSDKQDSKPSGEIDTWQMELNDMIWLELQAWHAERTLEEQDKFLCAARKDVPKLLDKILHYRFKPTYVREASVQSNDSGVSSSSESKEMNELNHSMARLISSDSDHAEVSCDQNHADAAENKCKDCVSLYCKYCHTQQHTALREVEELLTRLEDAEMLYPSSRVMGSYHPIYKSVVFVGRVKAMCLWYNITKYQRLKLTLIGYMFRRLQGKSFQWPPTEPAYDSNYGSATSSALENDDSGRESIDSRKIKLPRTIPKVKFTFDGDEQEVTPSPPDSAGSSDSMKEPPCFPTTMHDPSTGSSFAQFINDVQTYQLDPFSRNSVKASDTAVSPYRKYIEHIMKTRGLTKSLSFLHRMHNVIIRKVQLTLERVGQDDEAEFNADIFDYEFDSTHTTIDKEQEDELRRYGVWSQEAQSLHLPSYAPTFLFMSVIPLEIMHEYLRLRLESRPLKPNPLSLEQLMKEVREGLILAMTHRERFHKHIHTALEGNEVALEKYMKILSEYDMTVREVLAMYLDYVNQWVLEATAIDQQKAALSHEWSFTKLMAPMIHGEHAAASRKFGDIIGQLLQNISQRLLDAVKKINDQITVANTNDNYEMDKAVLLMICRDMQSMFIAERENSMRLLHFSKNFCRDLEQRDFHRDHQLDSDDESSDFEDSVTTDVCADVRTVVTQLQREVLSVRHTLTKVIDKLQTTCQDAMTLGEMDELDTIRTRSREILHQSFKFGFDYHKELVRLFESKIGACRDESCEFNLSLGIIEFAKMWMKFVTNMCELGRGVRPRWAAQGLDYLISACDPVNTKHLTESEFNELKAQMDACISHVVGKLSESEKTMRKRTSPRVRKVSGKTPSPRILGEEQKLLYHQLSVKEEPVSGSSAPNSPQLMRKQMSVVETDSTTLKVPKVNSHSLAMRRVRIRDSVNQLDLQLDQRWRNKNLIGQVKELNNNDKIHIRSRSVNFRWHRGIKIGQGSFGKVYTAVNNSTGELMAMKEIPIQPNETRAIRNVAEELKIFEGISHKFLVKYHGVEVHREELLIFMELCAEGTLESLVEVSGPLHEGLTRRFTAQLLTAVKELHKHGVVHRDVKTANIFLTNSGNCLKLGDFGSAAKIQSQTTVAGELTGLVGTQAYMAPEVVTRSNTDGHGRASDIWSTGCVTIEMASGKRPWYQYDSNFQIMFKVGMGETPEVPNALSTEGHAFLQHCLEHDPLKRWTAGQLLEHHFCKVDVDCDTSSLTPSRSNQRKMSLHRK